MQEWAKSTQDSTPDMAYFIGLEESIRVMFGLHGKSAPGPGYGRSVVIGFRDHRHRAMTGSV